MTLVSDFDFRLPPELIAQTAAARGESRLLALDPSARPLRTFDESSPLATTATVTRAIKMARVTAPAVFRVFTSVVRVRSAGVATREP